MIEKTVTHHFQYSIFFIIGILLSLTSIWIIFTSTYPLSVFGYIGAGLALGFVLIIAVRKWLPMPVFSNIIFLLAGFLLGILLICFLFMLIMYAVIRTGLNR